MKRKSYTIIIALLVSLVLNSHPAIGSTIAVDASIAAVDQLDGETPCHGGDVKNQPSMQNMDCCDNDCKQCLSVYALTNLPDIHKKHSPLKAIHASLDSIPSNFQDTLFRPPIL